LETGNTRALGTVVGRKRLSAHNSLSAVCETRKEKGKKGERKGKEKGKKRKEKERKEKGD
jgi:hypothetical protein